VREQKPDDHLPIRPVDLLVLLVLVDRRRHGYGIRQDIARVTADKVVLDAGNLYRCLRRLLDHGLVERLPARRGSDDERRRDYRLTPLGRRVATAEVARLRDLLRLEQVSALLGEKA
jgi:DNA-binding PadR family transcriptional regulator